MEGQPVLAVAGTHGKTTTTSLLTMALIAAGADPSYAVGGVLTATGRNAHQGAGDLFVAEADESDGAFLVYYAVRRDRHQRRGRPPRHLGHRGGLPPRRSTSSWRARPRGLPWSSATTPGAAALGRAGGRAGLERDHRRPTAEADLRCSRIELEARRHHVLRGRVARPAGRRPAARQSPAATTSLDALAAWPSGCGSGWTSTTWPAGGLGSFAGTRRRMELKGEAGGVRVYD